MRYKYAFNPFTGNFDSDTGIASILIGYTSGAGTISSADSILSAIQKLNGNVGALVTGVSSVSNSNGTLTISPTTGAVVASLNLGHANTWSAIQYFSAQTKFQDGTVSLPGIAFNSENSTGLYQIASGTTGFSSVGTQLVLLDSTANTTGYYADAHVMIKTADSTAGGSVKGSFSVINLGNNTFSLRPRANFSKLEVEFGNSTDQTYVVFGGPAQTAINRLDIIYNNAFWGQGFNGSTDSVLNFRGTVGYTRKGDPTDYTNPYPSANTLYEGSGWLGTTPGVGYSANFYIDIAPTLDGTGVFFYRFYTQQNLGAGTYLGNHFSVQVTTPRANPAYSGSFGLNAPFNGTLQAHLDIYEDLASRNILQLTGAPSQSGHYVNIKDNSNNPLFRIPSTGLISYYKGVATAGWGIPTIYGSGRLTAQTAAISSVATYTVGAADGSFEVSANANITAFVAGTFNVQVTYTDETNTAQTLTLNFSSLTGTIGIALAATGPFEGLVAHIRCKASTAITIKTAGTFTSLTYNVEGIIRQLS